MVGKKWFACERKEDWSSSKPIEVEKQESSQRFLEGLADVWQKETQEEGESFRGRGKTHANQRIFQRGITEHSSTQEK